MLIDGLSLTPTGRFKNSSIENVTALPTLNSDGREVVLTVSDGVHEPGAYTYINGVGVRLVDTELLDQRLSGLNSTAGINTWTGLPYDIATGSEGLPLADATLCKLVVSRAFSIPANFAGSRAQAKVAASQTCTFKLFKNAVQVGTFTFAAGASSATFSVQAKIDFAAGDTFTVVAPSVQDGTLSDVAFNIAATLQ